MDNSFYYKMNIDGLWVDGYKFDIDMENTSVHFTIEFDSGVVTFEVYDPSKSLNLKAIITEYHSEGATKCKKGPSFADLKIINSYLKLKLSDKKRYTLCKELYEFASDVLSEVSKLGLSKEAAELNKIESENNLFELGGDDPLTKRFDDLVDLLANKVGEALNTKYPSIFRKELIS
tara:strand:- start:286 stop:813 length:528 start_codon:yes stop_codon:yes gene_type:complete